MRLYEMLRSELPVCYLNSGNTEIVIRCPYCGDSTKSPNKGHFYIALYPPHKFICHRCDSRGLFNISMLNVLELTERDLRTYVFRNSFLPGRVNKMSRISTYQTLDLNLGVSNNRLYLQKYRYVVDRLKCNHDLLQRMRMISSLSDLIAANPKMHIDYDSLRISRRDNRSPQVRVENLDRNYVGFINHDCSHALFRRITEVPRLPRYKNVLLCPPEFDGDSFSVFSGNYNLMSDPVIHVGEGVMTVAGAYQYTKRPQDIWISGNSKSGLAGALSWVGRHGYVNSPIILWSDSEVGINFWKWLMHRNMILKNAPDVNILYNKNHEDFGYASTQIQPVLKILKGRPIWTSLQPQQF